ncbi:VPLPA-CTERM sorting domain-containing protein [Roseovarius sp. EL26]|uniref:VPLPA-CTERM sorting domain-containing protein n=1 Tax=Roseovarius sp. EL26 TaxID=2126672 RepID=UPI000EA10712|nr:VPLPA-CTERM sorting domain-containing protein [Roseovarius sp. EL26]
MKRTLLATTAIVALSASGAHASLTGYTSGPDASFFPISFFFDNSGADVLNLSIDGATADAGTVVWDTIGTVGGTAIVGGTAGVDTSLVSFSFGAGDFASGDTFSLSSLDPDFTGLPSSGVSIFELIGVSVSASFSDSSTFFGTFVDDPADGAGLVLKGETIGAVPLPAGLPLMLAGLGALGIASRRRRNNA